MAAVGKAGMPAVSSDCGACAAGALRWSSPWRTAMRAGRALRPELLLALLLALPCDGMNPPPDGQQGEKMPAHPKLTQQSVADEAISIEGTDASRASRHLHAFYLQQQESMVKDTSRLLKLAAELNADVSREHSVALTADERRKAAEIEKLARRVKEKMSDPVPPGGLGDQEPRSIFIH
ncbi:MAG: hypothetical protein P4K94_11190 [Terracidiphilus sp.]|nr:hypothetical protein [Terracidiphilus sp.]